MLDSKGIEIDLLHHPRQSPLCVLLECNRYVLFQVLDQLDDVRFGSYSDSCDFHYVCDRKQSSSYGGLRRRGQDRFHSIHLAFYYSDL